VIENNTKGGLHMENIIAKCLKRLDNLERWDEKIFQVVCDTASGSSSAVLEAIDKELAKTREKGLKIVGRRKRTVMTKFGPVVVNRRLYQNEDGNYRFLLDEALGLKTKTLATPTLEQTALYLASQMPFRQAAELLEKTSGGVLSHQMIHRILQEKGEQFDQEEEQATKELTENGVLPKSQNKKVKRLFIEADGTFINLQKEKKKKAEIKLIISHEGWRNLRLGRSALLNKKFVAGLYSNEDIWNRFTTNLLTTYTPEVLSKVVIGGDGASWVKSGAELFPESLYQLDRFHLRRALLQACGNFKVANQVYSLATEGNLKEAKKILAAQIRRYPSKEKELLKARNYLENNWSGLVDYRKRIKEKTDNLQGLGAIESNLDKVIANRMKKRGMAWSLKGAHHMAKIIQMRANGLLDEKLESQKASLTKKEVKLALGRVKRAFQDNPGAWMRASLPALRGPHQARPWVKTLKNIQDVALVGIQS
jgi:hypothetical protein